MLRVRNVAFVATCIAVTASGICGQKIGSQFTISGKGSKGDPVVAYGDRSGHFVAVWAERIGTRTQIRARRIATNGSVVGSEIVVAGDVRHDHSRPTIAYVRKSNRFVICWHRVPAGGGRAVILGRTLAPITGSLSGSKLLVYAVSDNLRPALGGDRTSVDNKAILVWERSGIGILSSRLHVPTFGAPSLVGSTYVISSASDAREATISRSGGDTRRYVVAYVKKVAGFLSHEVYARAVGADALPDGPEIAVSTGRGLDSSPSIDGDGTRFFVAWQGEQKGTIVRVNLYGRALTHDGTKIKVKSSKITIANSALDERGARVSFMLKKFFVGYSAEYSSNQPYKHDAFFKFYCPNSSTLCGSGKVRGPEVRDGYVAVVARYAGGSTTADDGMLVIASSSTSRWTNALMIGQRVESMGRGGTFYGLGKACGQGGSTHARSEFAIGNEKFGIGLTGASTSAKLAILNISPVQPPLLVCGGCEITAPTVLLPVPVVAGKAMLSLPIPCDPKLLNMSMVFQHYVLESGSTPCAGLTGLSFSRRAKSTIGF